jgi:hypothetical protein
MEHRSMLLKDVPIFLTNTVSGFATLDGGKFKGTMDSYIMMGDVKLFQKGQKIMALGIIVRCFEWTDQVCFSG